MTYNVVAEVLRLSQHYYGHVEPVSLPNHILIGQT